MLRLAKFLRAISWRQWFSAFDRLLQADGFLGNETAFVVKNAVPVFPLTDSTAIRLATDGLQSHRAATPEGYWRDISALA